MSTGEATATIAEILASYPPRRENLIGLLQEIQERHGYLSQDALHALADASGISENEIYGVATFYAQFRFRPPADHTIHVCQGTACHVRGGQQLLFDFEERLNIKAGEMTADQRFGLERVACVGCCALAPVVLVDGQVRAGMKPKQVRGLLSQLGHKPNGNKP
ncbi:MAG: NADH-quinone oxidoreductase subunit NuoE [Deltaproteobacteria bacterium]|nr:NADH-quinone oxidoreductase subunit NuoE [Deltaproteobacteria bacterium]